MLRAVARKEERIAVQKIYKLFIGGKFVRSESGRVTSAQVNGQVIANFPGASRKDFRDAMVVARGALAGWSNVSAYLRGQIIYRGAEILQMRRSGLEAELARVVGKRNSRAWEEAGLTIDCLVHCAGWTDKFGQIFGAVKRAPNAESPGLKDEGGRKSALDSRHGGDENGVAPDRTVEEGRKPELA